MKFIKKHRYLIITLILLIIYLFYYNYWELAIKQKITKDYLANIFIILSFSTLPLIFLPQNKRYLSKYRNDFIISFYIFFLEIIFIWSNDLTFTPLFIFALLFTIYSGFLILNLLPPVFKKGVHYLIICFLPFYLISQTIYVNIFNDFFALIEVVSLKEGLDFAEGVVSFNSIFIIYFNLALFTLILYKTKKITKLNLNYHHFLILIPLFLLVLFNLQRPVKQARMHTSDRYLFNEVFSHEKFISRFGATNYLLRDISRLIEPLIKSKPDYKQEIDDYFKKNEKKHLPNEYTGIFADKNLIFIMAESFDNIAINETLTPNIYKLQQEGWNFTNHFIPVYPRTTCDSEIIYNTTLIPSLNDGPTCFIYNQNSYQNSLANLFNDKEYQTNAFHSNSIEFYTRNILYKGFGYDEFYDQKRLELNDQEKRYDSIFYEKSRPFFFPTNKFMNFVITLSGHSPYEDSHLAVQKHLKKVEKYFKQKKEQVPTTVMAYMATQIELDLYIKLLKADLEKYNLLNDTVIILTADHYPYTLKKKDYEKYTNIKEQYLKNKSPLIIWHNELTPMTYTNLTQSFDLLPTIANLFALDTNYTYYFGNDIFTKDRLAVTFFKDYTWFDGYNYVKHNELISGNGNEKYITNTAQKIKEYYDISTKILRSNYFSTN